VRGEHRRSVPLSPTSAMTRGSLSRPRLRGRNLTYTSYSGPGTTCVGLIIKPRTHHTPCSLFCTTYRHHVRQWPCSSPCEHACTAERRGLSSSNANIAPACLLLLHAPHRSTRTRHVLASTKACDLRSAVHTPTTPSSLHTASALHCISKVPHILAPAHRWQGPTQTSPGTAAGTLFRQNYYASTPACFPRNQQQLSADRCLAESRYTARRASHDQVF
jgi:hypothetical protein